MSTVEVAIVGGGPAGSAAARLLASWGHDVVLLTRAADRHGLAESLPPSTAKLLDALRLRDAVDAIDAVRSTGNTVWWDGQTARVERFSADQQGWQVDRAIFDRSLLARAEAAGATVMRETSVQRVVARADGRHVLELSGSDGHTSLHARWVLDCTGRVRLTARQEPHPTLSSARTMAIVGEWESRDGWSLPDPSHTIVESFERGWAWSVPLSATRRQVTAMVDPAHTKIEGKGRLAAVYAAEVARTTHIARMVSATTARQLGDCWARDASPYLSSAVAGNNRLLVGDAASFVDPLSSFGVKKALASAWLAAIVAHTCLTRAERAGAAIGFYESRERAMFEALSRRAAEFSRDAAGRHGHPFWEDRAGLDPASSEAEPNIDELRRDADVLAAFAEIRERPALRLCDDHALVCEPRARVRGNEIVLSDHLVAPAFPSGIRYLRDVDLVRVRELTRELDQVPDLFEAYCRREPPVALPDFLGALAVLVGKGMLRFS